MTQENTLEWIKNTLYATFNPTHLEVHDQSYHHRNHPGAASGGGHFMVEIKAEAFAGKPLVHCHRMIYDALGNAVGTSIHAVGIKIIRN